jgi:hypothetical protein
MLENLTPRPARVASKIDQIRQTLSDEDAKLFDSYLRDVDGWTPNGLALALRTQGIELSGDTIRRYRLRHGYC